MTRAKIIASFTCVVLLALIVYSQRVYAQEQTPLVWAKDIGGIYYQHGQALAYDDTGNVYVTGYFNGKADFDPGAGTYYLSPAGNADIFILKLNSKGNFVWAKRVGGTGGDIGYSIALDDSGNVYVAGTFEYKTDFDPGSGTYYLTSPVLKDAFILKLTNSGNFIWAKQFTGIKEEVVYSIALDKSGNVYSTGYFQDSVDFDPGVGKYSLYTGLNGCVFVSKLTRGGQFVWARQMGYVNNPSIANSIALDDSAYIYTTGNFNGTADFDPGSGTYNLNSGGILDIFVSKLNKSGNFVWAAKLGGSADYEEGCGITTDKHGSVYATGYFEGTADFDPGTSSYNLTSAGGRDIFVCKLSRLGKFEWAKKMGSAADEIAYSVAVDDSCRSYIIGSYDDIVMYKLDSIGKTILKDVLGTNFGDRGYCIKVDPLYNIYSTGYFGNTIDFDPTNKKFFLTPQGYEDIFIYKMKQCRITTSNITVKTCVKYLVPSKKRTLSISGTFRDTIENSKGCDSIITIKLTINQPKSASHKVTSCRQYISPSKKYKWTTSNIFYDTIATIQGCDSLLTIKLTIGNNNTYDTISPVACYTYISPSNKYIWKKTGKYLDTIPNSLACDSIITINLNIINNTTYSFIASTVCDKYISPSHRYIWTSSGTYYDTLINSTGCDSIITIQLKVNNKSAASISPQVCRSYTSPSGKYIWMKSGKYTDIIPSANGCDSTITINLQVKTSIPLNISSVNCNSYTSPSGRYIWKASGTFKDTVFNPARCDSIFTVNLKINKSSSSVISPTSCKSYLSHDKKQTWKKSGTYFDTLKNAAGCDSFMTINLTIKNANITVTNNAPVLKANASPAKYQWLNCDSGYTKVKGAIDQSFMAMHNGSYAVEIYQDNCRDTSACYIVSNVWIHSINQPYIRLFPNPTSSDVEFVTSQNLGLIRVLVYGLNGTLLFEKNFDESSFKFNIPGSTGLYFVKVITSNNEEKVFRVMKK